MPSLNRTQSDRVFVLLFALLTALNALVLWGTPLTLAPDESHYWEWSRRLDWSYYSKGPLIAWVIAGSTAFFGDTEIGVRFPAFAFFTVFSLCYYVFVRRFFLPLYALLSWLAVRSMLMFIQTGIGMTTDPPAAFFWFLGVAAAYLAVVEERRMYWLVFGVSIGVGVWAKYTLFLLYPSIILLLVLTPQLRPHLRSREFLLGSILLALCLTPILVWNSRHNWANFAHNAGHVVKTSGFTLTGKYFFELIGGQIGLAGPVVFAGLIYGIARGTVAWRKGDIPAGVFLFSALPIGLLVCGISLTKRVYPNWPLPFYIGAMLLFTHLLTQRAIFGDRVRRLITWGLILNAVIAVAAHAPFLGFPLGVPGDRLPTKKLVGWDVLGAQVESALKSRVADRPFVLGDDYEVISSIAFYAPSHPEVYCANLDDRRMNQYDIWGGLGEQKRRTALIVLKSREKLERLRPHFAVIEEAGTLSVDYSGDRLKDFFLYWGESYDGSNPEAPVKR